MGSPPGVTTRLVRRPRALRLVSIGLAVAVLVTASGCDRGTSARGAGESCAISGRSAECAQASASAGDVERVDVSVVGDSITAGLRPLVGQEIPDETSWVPGALGAPLVYRGGWAIPGSTTGDMVQGAQTSAADVVVVLGGTNDLTFGLPQAQTLRNIEDIVIRVEVPRVVLSAIPPKDDQPEEVRTLNEALADLAADHGWAFVDPWAGVDDAGRFRAGVSPDGIHPRPAAAADAGALIRAAVLTAAGD